MTRCASTRWRSRPPPAGCCGPCTGSPARASWDDPLADLAQLRLHVRQHHAAAADAVTAGYGAADPARLDAYELVHAVRERAWVAYDHPPNEATALPALDALISARIAG